MTTVLLVDDAPDLRYLLRECLEQHGQFEVVGEAGGATEAIEVARSTHPEAIVLDLALPGTDGLELIPELHRVAPGCRILVLSGFASSHMADQVLAMRADAYMQKTPELSTEIASRLDSVMKAPPRSH